MNIDLLTIESLKAQLKATEKAYDSVLRKEKR